MSRHTHTQKREFELERLDEFERDNETGPAVPLIQNHELAQDPEAQPPGPPEPLPPFFPALNNIKFTFSHPFFLTAITYTLPILTIFAIPAYLYSPPNFLMNCRYDLSEHPGPFINCAYTCFKKSLTLSNPIFSLSAIILVLGITALGHLTLTFCLIHAAMAEHQLQEPGPPFTGHLIMVGFVGGILGLGVAAFFMWVNLLTFANVLGCIFGRVGWQMIVAVYHAVRERFRRYRLRQVQ
ncbi:hypothetical protein AOL_s00078g206 [Orbilia oligospora ATCC 24927]|uniref:Uncharacterized protein n=2 Tax=Orbilia oligospora TaxID=2813651 RepID=G1XBA9_ARTOA|nr:hypothetical protein AOL_s00078g206 [Orbilia oligospora ATCC 24927]EGX49717.1 hypothetical protein AOL_s00078g206 [Orbilia oligospora ATCC 24927]KAF3288376.1 hypothetical protein TWF970_005452 [Orbilia oligospora]